MDFDDDFPVTRDERPEVTEPIHDADGSALTDIRDPRETCPVDDSPGDAAAE
jgi:hypothetical protein